MQDSDRPLCFFRMKRLPGKWVLSRKTLRVSPRLKFPSLPSGPPPPPHAPGSGASAAETSSCRHSKRMASELVIFWGQLEGGAEIRGACKRKAIHPSVWLSVCLSMYTCIMYPSNYLSMYLSVYLGVSLALSLSLYIYIYIYVHMCMCVSVSVRACVPV